MTEGIRLKSAQFFIVLLLSVRILLRFLRVLNAFGEGLLPCWRCDLVEAFEQGVASCSELWICLLGSRENGGQPEGSE